MGNMLNGENDNSHAAQLDTHDTVLSNTDMSVASESSDAQAETQVEGQSVPGERFHCDQCSASYSRLDTLHIHKQFHSRKVKISHTQKPEQLPKHGGFMNHRAKQLKPTKYSCDKCPSTFSRPTELMRHLYEHSSDGCVFRCEQCSKRFVRKSHLKLHLRHHASENGYRCGTCPSSFANKSSRDRHELLHTMKVLSELGSMQNVGKSLMGTEVKGKSLHKCDQCSTAFIDFDELQSHLLEFHPQEESSAYRSLGKLFDINASGPNRVEIDNLQIKIPRMNISTSSLKSLSTTCQYCGKKFKHARSLRKHELCFHADAKPYRCNKCPAAFYRKDYLGKHQQAHERRLAYRCTTCSASYSHERYLLEHLQVHSETNLEESSNNAHEENTDLQEKLSESNTSIAALSDVSAPCSTSWQSPKHESRKSVVSGVSRPYKCMLCSESFKLSSDLKYHLTSHARQKMHRCEECPMRFNRKENLKLHIRKVHGENMLHQSDRCSASFCDDASFTQHQRIHLQSSDGSKDRFRCDKCHSVFKDSSGLNKHKQIHKQFKCDECDASFTEGRSLSNHKRIHSRQSQPTGGTQPHELKCDVCSATFSKALKLKLHKLSHKQNLITCDECPTALSSLASFIRHKMIHQAKKAFKCDQCSASFRSVGPLTFHKRCHTQPKTDRLASSTAVSSGLKLECKQCSKSFSTVANLKSHQLVHKNAKRFKCESCPAAFNRKDYLLTHQKAHQTGTRRPFKCHQCSASFVHSCRLSQHMVIHSKSPNLSMSIKTEKTDKSEESEPARSAFVSSKHNPEQKPLVRKSTRSTTSDREQKTGSAGSPSKGTVHMCAKCPTSFARIEHVKRHMIVHTRRAPYKCNRCSASYFDHTRLAKHKAVHYGKNKNLNKSNASTSKPTSNKDEEKQYRCESCPAVYTYSDGLKRHQKVHYLKRQHKCPHCTASYNMKRTLTLHLRIHKSAVPSSTVPTCRFCFRKFKDSCTARIHERLHTGVKPYACKRCPAAFHLRSYLLVHERAHNEKRSLKCPYCSASYSNKKHLSDHMQVHSEVKSKPDREILESGSLNRGQAEINRGQKTLTEVNGSSAKPTPCTTSTGSSLKCGFCKKKFSARYSLRSHLRLHTGDKPFLCHLCPSAFHRRDYLRTHLRAHSKKRAHTCPHCSASYDIQRHLNEHMVVHTESQTEVKLEQRAGGISENENIGKNAVENTELKDSALTSKTSSNSKLLTPADRTCRFCFRIFSAIANLKVHERLHTGERPYRCKKCPAAYIRSDYLLKHQQAHGARKPFKCPHCSASYGAGYQLTEHLSFHSTAADQPSVQSANDKCRDEENGTKPLNRSSHNASKYPCNQCPATYVEMRSLLRHQKAHYVRLPFQCDLCTASYRYRHALSRHKRFHTSSKTDRKGLESKDSHSVNVETEMLIKQEPQERIDELDQMASIPMLQVRSEHDGSAWQKPNQGNPIPDFNQTDFTSLTIGQLVDSGKKCFIAVYDDDEWKTAGSISIVNSMKKYLPDFKQTRKTQTDSVNVSESADHQTTNCLSVADLDKPEQHPPSTKHTSNYPAIANRLRGQDSTPQTSSKSSPKTQEATVLTALETPQFSLQATVLNSANEECSLANAVDLVPRGSKRTYQISLDVDGSYHMNADGDSSQQLTPPNYPPSKKRTNPYDEFVQNSDNQLYSTRQNRQVERTPYDDLFGVGETVDPDPQKAMMSDDPATAISNNLDGYRFPIPEEKASTTNPETACLSNDGAFKPLLDNGLKPLVIQRESSTSSFVDIEHMNSLIKTEPVIPSIDTETMSDCESNGSDWSVIDITDLTPNMVAGLSMTPCVVLPKINQSYQNTAQDELEDGHDSDIDTILSDQHSLASDASQHPLDGEDKDTPVIETSRQSSASQFVISPTSPSIINGAVPITENRVKDGVKDGSSATDLEFVLTPVDLDSPPTSSVVSPSTNTVIPAVPDADLTLSAINCGDSNADSDSPLIIDEGAILPENKTISSSSKTFGSLRQVSESPTVLTVASLDDAPALSEFNTEEAPVFLQQVDGKNSEKDTPMVFTLQETTSIDFSAETNCT